MIDDDIYVGGIDALETFGEIDHYQCVVKKGP